MEPTNQDLLVRIDALEEKVDTILQKMYEARGAWLFAKWMAGLALGFAAFYSSVHDWWIK